MQLAFGMLRSDSATCDELHGACARMREQSTLANADAELQPASALRLEQAQCCASIGTSAQHHSPFSGRVAGPKAAVVMMYLMSLNNSTRIFRHHHIQAQQHRALLWEGRRHLETVCAGGAGVLREVLQQSPRFAREAVGSDSKAETWHARCSSSTLPCRAVGARARVM